MEHAHLARALRRHAADGVHAPGRSGDPRRRFPEQRLRDDDGQADPRRHAPRGAPARGEARPTFRPCLPVFSRNGSSDCQMTCVAELTGPLIVDRGRNIGFCGLTERCDRSGRRSDARGLRPRPDVRLRARSGRVPHQRRDVGAGEPRAGHPPALVPRPRSPAGDRRPLRRAGARAHGRREGGLRRQLHRALRDATSG